MGVGHKVTLITTKQGARRDFTRFSTSGFLPASVEMWPGIEAQEGFGAF